MSFLLLIALFFVEIADAEELIVISQVVSTEFTAKKAKLLINNNQRAFRKAALIVLNDKELLALALLPKENLSVKNTYYSFILSDEKNHLFSTPFSEVKKLNEAKSYKAKLENKNNILNLRLTGLRSQQEKLREESQKLESELGDKIDLANIIQLKSELESVNNSLEFFTDTKNYLFGLLQNRKNIKEPKDIAANSKILSMHLNDAAKVTAAAERLSRKKKETNLGKFKQQIRAIEEMQQADLSAMAKQLLELRNARRKLENTDSAETQNQF